MKYWGVNKKQIHIALLVVSVFVWLVYLLDITNGNIVTEQSESRSEQELPEVVNVLPKDAFFTEDIEIMLTVNQEFIKDENTVYYTLDGSVPTTESLQYIAPIKVTANDELQTIVIRASVLDDGVMSKPVTRTYFVGKNVDSRFTTKVVSIVTDEENLYDYENGIFVPGKTYDDWLAAGGDPNAEDYTKDGNYKQRTDDWIRDAHVEVFLQNGEKIVDLDAGISVAGSASASYPIKSINIKADEKFDTQTMYFNFVEDGSEINGKVFSHVGNETNSVRLRNSGNDLFASMIRQNICNELALQSGLMTTSVVTPVVTYLNGEYYALLQAQNNFSSSNLGKMLSLETDYIVKAGEAEYQIFSTLSDTIDFTTADFNEVHVREEFERLVDIEEFFLYNAIQIMIDNGDWPNNNYKVMYYTGTPIEENPYSDGKLHFLFFGTDFAFQLYSDKEPMFEVLFNSNVSEEQKCDSEHIITKMMQYEPYKQTFVNEVCDLMATSFQPKNVEGLFDKYLDQIRDELPYLANAENEVLREIAGGLEEEVSNTRLRTSERIQFVYPAYLWEYFGAADPYQLMIESPGIKGKVICNTVSIDEDIENTFNGMYYRNFPIHIKAESAPGYRFSYFLINGEEYTDSEFVITDELIIEDKLHIEAYFEETEGTWPIISEVYAQGNNDYIVLMNPYINDIHLEDFYLSDNKNELWKYKCPSIILKHGESIRIAGSKNPIDTEYKTGFALKEMETVYLSDNYGEIRERYFIPRGIK